MPDMELIIKIVGGVIAGLLTFAILRFGLRSAMGKTTHGQLYFGGFMAAIAIVCSLIVLGMVAVLFLVEHGGQDIAILSLIGMFGVFAAYGWAELFGTRGEFDDSGIRFQSLVGGKRRFSWGELRSIRYSDSMHWYVMTFRNRQKIRVSVYMHGIRELLEQVEALDVDVERQ